MQKLHIGSTVRFIWKNVNWQGKVIDIQQGQSKASIAVLGYPNMISAPIDQLLILD